MIKIKKSLSGYLIPLLLILITSLFCGCSLNQSNEDEIYLTVEDMTAPPAVTITIQNGIITEAETETVTSEEEEVTEITAEEAVTSSSVSEESEYKEYKFRNSSLLNNHYKKHGEEMGFASAEEYEKAASDVVNSSEALHKKEKEDNDDVYYIESTNEFVVVSSDGYLRTYFYPDAGKKYYDRQ